MLQGVSGLHSSCNILLRLGRSGFVQKRYAEICSSGKRIWIAWYIRTDGEDNFHYTNLAERQDNHRAFEFVRGYLLWRRVLPG